MKESSVFNRLTTIWSSFKTHFSTGEIQLQQDLQIGSSKNTLGEFKMTAAPKRKDRYENPFSKLIFAQRKKLNITMDVICSELNCHRTSVQSWDSGDYLPKHDKVIKFAKMHEIDIKVFNDLYEQLQAKRKSELPKLLRAKPAVEEKKAMTDDEIEDLVDQADRYLLFTKKQVVKLIKQVEFKHGLRSEVE